MKYNPPNGTILLWPAAVKLPEGWIIYDIDSPQEETEDYDNSNWTTILIQKVDNLTWIEHLAKQRGLVV